MSDHSYALDEALHLEPLGPGHYRLGAAQAYWNFTSAFGGWALAAAFAGVSRHEDSAGDLLTLGAVFPDALPEEPLDLHVSPIRMRSRTQFWKAQIVRPEQTGAVLFECQLVLSKRKEHETGFDRPPPAAKAPEDCTEMDMTMGLKWLRHYRQRPVSGTPFSKQEEPASLVWIEEADGRPWDEAGLIAVSDTMMPRVFFADTVPRFGATASYSLHSFVTAEEIRKLGTMPLLVETNSDAIALGSYDQRARVWSQAGQLLFVTNQVGIFR
ncbi:acyl-CoA thioesterase [Qipengyuania sp. DSG2-2]|uniref:acyl-CoA thioesterase n=1 Tax=Qipengyuania sp. DGS2-2 TaxID=3349631 RepID=UPI0036D2871A